MELVEDNSPKQNQSSNNTIYTKETLERELVLASLVKKYPLMEFERYSIDDEILLNFKIPHWKNTNSFLMFLFKSTFVLASLKTDLPNVKVSCRTVFDDKSNFKKKKEELYEFVYDADNFVSKYDLMLTVSKKLSEEFDSSKLGIQCFFDYVDRRSNFLLFGEVKGVGRFHYNLVDNNHLMFASETGFNKKIFNINGEKEDEFLWNSNGKFDYTLCTVYEFGESYERIFNIIRNSIFHSLEYSE